MAESSTFLAWAESLEAMSYYEILRVPDDAPPGEIQQAFHDLSLRCHPDRFVEEGPEVSAAAAAVFKRAAEAYNILRKPAFRARYDAELQKGKLKLDERAVEPKKQLEQRTLFMIARTAKAKQHAAKADELLARGKLDDARIQLITANQHDPNNDELKERLDILYEALLLEPGDLL
ncbi:MAG: DnaJ domain-containing protein [Labilithrix sp.]|nr:DnaJ domain-containing protein [Labilithrix sp.]